MPQHSSIIGGSNAGRLINCPGSHQAINALPVVAEDIPSEYANEGTAMHEAMAVWLNTGGISVPPDRLRGITCGDRVITQDHLDSMIIPAIDCLLALCRHYGGDYHVFGVEQPVVFPKIPGAFGTCDLILQSATHTLLVDWKFGSGVGVKAEYPDGTGTYVNPQLMYYLAAALRSKPAWFRGRKLVVAIIQPRGMEPLSHTEVERGEVKDFVKDVERAVLAAIGRDPPRVRGEWCRFAPCKTACPLWTGPLLELAALMPVKVATGAEPTDAYAIYLSRAKALIDSLVMMKSTIDEQMHTYLTQGGVIPGWRLKYKTKMRQWVDADLVAARLRGLGFTEEQIWQQKLLTFASADAIAKQLGVEIPGELRQAPPSTETTLATTDDPAPVVEPAKLVEQFSASLKQLQQQGARPQIAAAQSKK